MNSLYLTCYLYVVPLVTGEKSMLLLRVSRLWAKSWKVSQENTNRDKFLCRKWSFLKRGVCLEPTFEATALITCEANKFQSQSWPEATTHPPKPPLMIFLLMFNTGKQVHYLLCINLSQIRLINPRFTALPFRWLSAQDWEISTRRVSAGWRVCGTRRRSCLGREQRW